MPKLLTLIEAQAVYNHYLALNQATREPPLPIVAHPLPPGLDMYDPVKDRANIIYSLLCIEPDWTIIYQKDVDNGTNNSANLAGLALDLVVRLSSS